MVTLVFVAFEHFEIENGADEERFDFVEVTCDLVTLFGLVTPFDAMETLDLG